MDNQLTIFVIWLKTDDYTPTEHFQVFAYTLKQAVYFFTKLLEGNPFYRGCDWGLDRLKDKTNCRHNHKCGEIWNGLECDL